MAFSFFMRRKDGEKKFIPVTKDATQHNQPPKIDSAPKKPEAISDDRKPVIAFVEKKPEVITNNSKAIEPSEKKPAVVAGDKPVYAFIDASNLFWGGKESMGFGIDYKKLLNHLEKEYGVTKAFYYSGLRIFDFEYSILDYKPMDFVKLTEFLRELKKTASEKDAFLIDKSLNKINFYQLLESYGYDMKIKPAKVYYGEDDENEESPILKANCDVDMTFDMMRYMQQYSGIVAMTGDGDFAPVLNYLKFHGRSVVVMSRWNRTAKEIKTIVEKDFVDFEKLRNIIQYRG